MKLPTVTIGIPCYNEEANIGHLITDILRLVSTTVRVEKIIVASDGSTDRTCDIVLKTKDKRVVLLRSDKREGAALRQNDIIKATKSDILVLLDADIAIFDEKFLDSLCAPLLEGNAEMSSSALTELPPRTYFEDVLAVSMRLKRVLFSAYKSGNNVYMCHGPARAMAKSFYRSLRFKTSDGEDMYSYLACLSKGFRFAYISGTSVSYRLPAYYQDHSKQSLRFIRAQNAATSSFDQDLVKKELTIPFSAWAAGAMRALPIILTRPVHIITYVTVLLAIGLRSLVDDGRGDNWGVGSSKDLRRQYVSG